MSLKVGIDLRDMRIAKTGTGTYLGETFLALKKLEDADFKLIPFDTTIRVYTGKNKALKLFEHLRFQIWKQIILPFKAASAGCDVLFCTDFFVPYLKLGFKTVPVFHDAFFFEYPEHYNKIWLLLFKLTAIPAAKTSPFVVVPTEYAKTRISLHYRLPLNKLKVISEGPKTLPDPDDDFIREFHLSKDSYILHVGSLDKRKNIVNLLKAFKLYREAGHNHLLVLAGKAFDKVYSNSADEISTTIDQLNIKKYIILTGYISDQTLSAFYKNAFMYVFPSINEGFGIPVLESFKAEIPVLVADNTCLPEIGADAVITFNPFNPEDIAKKMISVTESAELRSEMIQRGRERLKTFSWDQTASELKNLFKKAADE